MNKVVLMGRLTRDPEVRYTQGEQSMAVARFTLAVDRRFRKEGEKTADFISCAAFGKIAEFIEKYCHQGTKLVVEGRIQTGSYTNREGTKVYTTDVVVEAAEFAESKAAGQGTGGSDTSGAAGQGSREQNRNQSRTNGSYGQCETDADGFMRIPDGVEGLPFMD